jgi:hypothetical protein
MSTNPVRLVVFVYVVRYDLNSFPHTDTLLAMDLLGVVGYERVPFPLPVEDSPRWWEQARRCVDEADRCLEDAIALVDAWHIGLAHYLVVRDQHKIESKRGPAPMPSTTVEHMLMCHFAQLGKPMPKSKPNRIKPRVPYRICHPVHG